MSSTNFELENELTQLIADVSDDPVKFVRVAFPWNEEGGELEGFDGPDDWQLSVLSDIRDGLLDISSAIQLAVASGHGIGKSALVAWIILWAISTMPNTKGVVTANTENQLKTKTWAELAKWYRLLINKHWFELTATAIYAKDPAYERTWRIDMVPWSETRSEAFAGLHNKGRRVLVVYDEASAISDMIWEVTEGALTDENTEIIWVAFGNPTRARGRFVDCFHRFKHRWKTRQIDSRTVKMTNKAQLNAWVEDYGEDSDFVKVRVRGVFPSADVNALLTPAEVEAAMTRNLTEREIYHAGRVLGVDVARQGADDSVIARRQGLVVFPLESMHIPDSQLVAAKVAVAQERWDGGVDATFVDGTGGYGAGVIDKLRHMGRSCTEVYFSGKATDPRYFNKRSEMWFEMAKWIQAGGQLPRDNDLRDELLAATFTFSGDKFKLCEKEEIRTEIGRSPDRADAVALTFAYPVSPNTRRQYERGGAARIDSARRDYNPLERD